MKILHLNLKPIGSDYAELRYFWDNPNYYQSRQLPLSKIEELIKEAERDYYTIHPKDYAKIGQEFYNWLDGSERLLENEINKHRRDGIVLAIAATERLAHLPWELLHDRQRFLVERGIIPVRWKADDSTQQLTPEENQQENRALNVLFMASSPINSDLPELDFEVEEGRILEATKRIRLSLTVEESGCLNELDYLLQESGESHFDVFHLTAHVTKKDEEDEKLYFITETELGERVDSSAEDIANVLQFKQIKLIFLSGCETGYSRDEGTVPSMAETLLTQGATAVLSWGKKVSDTDATAAAATLYENLSAGDKVTQAVAKTYQTLIKNKAKDWHLLRLYIAETLPEALVTRTITPERRPAPSYSRKEEFRDQEHKLRVVDRKDFVGRRRQLQNCLRTLKTDEEKLGVLIHGMGGLGKSTIASRLWDRLDRYKKVFWWRDIDESSLVSKLADELENQEQRTRLRGVNEELKYRLRDVFSTVNIRLVHVFDDFEWNLEFRDGEYVLKPKVAKVLSALIWAIQNSEHRIIITCRYEFKSDLLRHFYKQPLEGLPEADLQKKLRQLEAFNPEKIDEKLIERALKLADRNPRLLEFLNKVLLKENADSELSQLEANPQEWKGTIIWEDFCKLVEADPKIQKIISRCLVFEIRVPMSALEAVCESISDYKKQLSRAVELGLIEVSPEPEESKRVYRVSRILPHIIPTIRLPEEPKVYSLYRKASERLYQLWGKRENESEEKWQEIFRLTFADRENPGRFKQGFDWMLEVVYNNGAETAFRSELKKVASYLGNLFTQLEEYLRQNNWEEADRETLWIFYQVMAISECENWWDLITDQSNNFPCKDLRAINRLWVKYSNRRFGFSVQKEIYLEVGGILDAKRNDEAWEKFVARVYPVVGETEEKILYDITAPVGHLPFLCLIYSPRQIRRGSFSSGNPWIAAEQPQAYELVLRLAQTCEL